MDLADFIDIHCHILPGLDDGPKKLEQSLELVRCYTSVGIKRVVATPHFLPGTIWTANRFKILDTITELHKVLSDNGIQFEIIPGMEIAIQKGMGRRLKRGDYLALGRSATYLLEPPIEIVHFNPLEPLAEFIDQDKKVILAHPERCEYFQCYPETLQQVRRRGVAVQVNCGSLLGRFGPAAEKLARRLLEWEAIDYLASDAHSAAGRRPPDISEWNKLQNLISPKFLRRIAALNPLKLLA